MSKDTLALKYREQEEIALKVLNILKEEGIPTNHAPEPVPHFEVKIGNRDASFSNIKEKLPHINGRIQNIVEDSDFHSAELQISEGDIIFINPFVNQVAIDHSKNPRNY